MYILTINKGGGGIYLNKSAIHVAKKAYYIVTVYLFRIINVPTGTNSIIIKVL
jgi:hypothetical protein